MPTPRAISIQKPHEGGMGLMLQRRQFASVHLSSFFLGCTQSRRTMILDLAAWNNKIDQALDDKLLY